MSLKGLETRKHSGGQLFSVDLLLASVVFLLIILLTIAFADSLNREIALEAENSERGMAAITAAGSLIYTGGSPANWENFPDLNNVDSIGLADTRNVLDAEKTARFVDVNALHYGRAKDILGTAKYDLGVTILRLQDRSVMGEFGLEPGPEDRVSAASRLVLYKGEEALLRVRVFGK